MTKKHDRPSDDKRGGGVYDLPVLLQLEVGEHDRLPTDKGLELD